MIEKGSKVKYKEPGKWGTDTYTVDSILDDKVYYEEGGFDDLDDVELVEEESKSDMIVEPNHYNGTEVFEQMLKIYGLEAVKGFCICNSFKYRQRAGKKVGNTIEQDINKAIWYENKLKELNAESK